MDRLEQRLPLRVGDVEISAVRDGDETFYYLERSDPPLEVSPPRGDVVEYLTSVLFAGDARTQMIVRYLDDPAIHEHNIQRVLAAEYPDLAARVARHTSLVEPAARYAAHKIAGGEELTLRSDKETWIRVRAVADALVYEEGDSRSTRPELVRRFDRPESLATFFLDQGMGRMEDGRLAGNPGYVRFISFLLCRDEGVETLREYLDAGARH